MIFVAICIVSVISFYFYCTRNFNYWKVRGVKHDKPILVFGTNYDNYTMKKSISQMAADTYLKYPNEKVVGFFRSTTPELVIRDPDIVKRILVTDFPSFHPRGFSFLHETEREPLAKNIFMADGDLWKYLRSRMSPAFTSGKLKAMFPLIVERANVLQSRLAEAAAKGRTIQTRELMARYTTDFIGACGFGLDADSLNDDNSKFRELGRNTMQFSVWQIIAITLKNTFPEIFKNLKIFGMLEKETEELVDAIQKLRNYEPCDRNDFIDLMLESKKKGAVLIESMEKFGPDGKSEMVQMELNNELITAGVLGFFIAGFETSSASSSYTLLQLAYNPEIQKKVQREIDDVLSRHNNQLSFDAVKEMTYLECAFKEAMRKFPPVGYLQRKCTKKYTLPEANVTIDKGVVVYIPIQALHTDPKYFDNPKEFRPERFLTENLNEKTKFVYLPFGEGPRVCVGARLGLMQSIAGLAAVLSRFTVEPTSETLEEPIIDPKSPMAQGIIGDIPLYFRERKSISNACG